MAQVTELEDRIGKCNKILNENPNSQIFAALAEAYRKKGEIDKAFRICQTGLKIHPNYGSAHMVMAKINFDKGKVVGEIIQRRGVSRDKRPGGSKRMDLPMNPTTFIGKGKVDEIKTLCKETQADGVIFLNPLNSTQINNVESEIDCWVKVWKIK